MSVFADAVDALFTDPNMARDAVYVAGGGEGQLLKDNRGIPFEFTDNAGRGLKLTLRSKSVNGSNRWFIEKERDGQKVRLGADADVQDVGVRLSVPF